MARLVLSLHSSPQSSSCAWRSCTGARAITRRMMFAGLNLRICISSVQSDKLSAVHVQLEASSAGSLACEAPSNLAPPKSYEAPINSQPATTDRLPDVREIDRLLPADNKDFIEGSRSRWVGYCQGSDLADPQFCIGLV